MRLLCRTAADGEKQRMTVDHIRVAFLAWHGHTGYCFGDKDERLIDLLGRGRESRLQQVRAKEIASVLMIVSLIEVL